MNKILSLSVLLGLSLTAAFPQNASTGTQTAPSTTEVTAYLTLTTAQLTSLATIKTNYNTASESLRTQVAAKQRELINAIRNNADATTIGKLTQELTTLQTQLTALATTYRTQAIAVLTADQKTKLKVLDDASKVQVQVQQATYLFLIAPTTTSTGFGRNSLFRISDESEDLLLQ